MNKPGISILLSFFLSSCYYDNAEDLTKICTTGNVTYSTNIADIIKNNHCLACHKGPSPIGGFSLESYNDVKAKVNERRLVGALEHANGYIAMPQGFDPLNQCDLAKVKAWITAGMPQ